MAALIAVAGSGPTAVAATRLASPVVRDCGAGPALVRPSRMILTCADDGMLATHLRWSSWTPSGATGTGTVTWRTGTAGSAASIVWHSTSAQVTLTDPVSEPGKATMFTRLQLHVTGPTPPRFMRNVAFNEAPMPKSLLIKRLHRAITRSPS